MTPPARVLCLSAVLLVCVQALRVHDDAQQVVSDSLHGGSGNWQTVYECDTHMGPSRPTWDTSGVAEGQALADTASAIRMCTRGSTTDCVISYRSKTDAILNNFRDNKVLNSGLGSSCYTAECLGQYFENVEGNDKDRVMNLKFMCPPSDKEFADNVYHACGQNAAHVGREHGQMGCAWDWYSSGAWGCDNQDCVPGMQVDLLIATQDPKDARKAQKANRDQQRNDRLNEKNSRAEKKKERKAQRESRRAAGLGATDYAYGPLGSDCDQQFLVTTEAECRAAMTSMDEISTEDQIGAWNWVPIGCSVKDGSMHWNSHGDGKNSGQYSPICRSDEKTNRKAQQTSRQARKADRTKGKAAIA